MTYRILPVLLSLFLSGAVNAETKLVGGDMHFHGTVMALACSLPPNADKIEVDFGQIAAKDLYLSGRSQPQAFTYVIVTPTFSPRFPSPLTVLKMQIYPIIWP